MTQQRIDVLNIGLIILSLVLAFKIPFELFLFSYAFLGPLHYLTEINWLHDKNYFSKNTHLIWFLVGLSFLVCLAPTLQNIALIPSLKQTLDPIVQSKTMSVLSNVAPAFLFIGMALSIAAIQTSNLKIILMVGIIAAFFAYGLQDVPNYILFIGVFTPTIFHVYVFTGIFMLYGALKSKSTWGVVSFISLLLATWIIVEANIDPKQYVLSEITKQNYISSTFAYVSQGIAHFFDLNKPNKPFHLLSEAGLKIQIFIAFAYTYHYLNWFSKTSIIKWHEVSKKQAITILSLWLISISLYYYNYKVGFVALLFLSMLHVFLEFPLNMTSIQGIYKHFTKC